MSRNLAAIPLQLVQKVRTIDYQKYRDWHQEKWGDKQAAFITGFLPSAVISIPVIFLTFEPGLVLYLLMFKLGLSLGFAAAEERRWFVSGAAAGSSAMILGQFGLAAAFLLGIVSWVPALMISAIAAVWIRRKLHSFQNSALGKLLALGPPDEFYDRVSVLSGRAKWQMWADATPKHLEFWRDDLARRKKVSRKVAAYLAMQMPQQGQRKIQNRRSR